MDNLACRFLHRFYLKYLLINFFKQHIPNTSINNHNSDKQD